MLYLNEAAITLLFVLASDHVSMYAWLKGRKNSPKAKIKECEDKCIAMIRNITGIVGTELKCQMPLRKLRDRFQEVSTIDLRTLTETEMDEMHRLPAYSCGGARACELCSGCGGLPSCVVNYLRGSKDGTGGYQKIRAIKELRDWAYNRGRGMGLREAKDAVERW